MREAQTHYTKERNGYLLEVRPASELAISYVAKITNLATGATRESGGWSSRLVAVLAVQDMYNEARLVGP